MASYYQYVIASIATVCFVLITHQLIQRTAATNSPPLDIMSRHEAYEHATTLSKSVHHNHNHQHLRHSLHRPKILLLRHFYDSPAERVSFRAFCMNNGFSSHRCDLTCIVVSNGSFPTHLRASIPSHVIVIERDNVGLDFGAYLHAMSILDTRKNAAVEDIYDAVLCINGTVMGPMSMAADWIKSWFDIAYTRDAGISGLSINIQRERWGSKACPHVQSMIFMVMQDAIKSLRSEDGPWSRQNTAAANKMTKDEIITTFEIGTSQWLLAQGFGMWCALKPLSTVDWQRFYTDDVYRKSVLLLQPNEDGWGDPWSHVEERGMFYGNHPTVMDIHVSAVPFFKSNRFTHVSFLRAMNRTHSS